MDMKIARQSDWKTEPLPAKRAVIPLDRRFSLEDMTIARRGVIPEQMEDKWFIYWSADELYFHRSWTGHCVYVVKFEAEQTGFRMIEALANRDHQQYQGTSDAQDKAMISLSYRRRALAPPARLSQCWVVRGYEGVDAVESTRTRGARRGAQG